MQRKIVQSLFSNAFKRISLTPKPPCACFHAFKNTMNCERRSAKVPTEPQIDFSALDPDEFGTLKPQKAVNDILDEMPEEKDDKLVFDVTNEEGRKTRKPLKFYENLIKKLIEEKKIVEALEVMEDRMKREYRKPTYYFYNLLINGCAKVGYTQKAFKLYKEMKERDIKRTPATYTGLFNACAHSPFPEDALIKLNHLRKILAEKCIDLTPINYNVMIKAYARLKDTHAAFLAADELLNKGYSLQQDTCAFLFQACISDRECGLRHALLLWHKMRQKKIKPTIYHYNLLIRCVRDCGLGDEDELQDVIQRIGAQSQENCTDLVESDKADTWNLTISWKTKNIEPVDQPEVELKTKPTEHFEKEMSLVENRPNLLAKKPYLGDIVAVTTIKTPHDRLLLLGGFKTLLEQMKLDEIKPDIKTFTELLDVMPSSVEAEQYLLKEIENAKVDIDIDFCNMLMKQRAVRRDYEGSRKVLDLIQSNYLHPDIVTFGVMALSCRKLSEARELIGNLKAFSYRMNIEILGAFLSNATYNLDFDYVLFILKLTKNYNIQPSEEYMQYLETMEQRMVGLLRRIKRKDKSLPRYANKPEFVENYRMFKEYYDKWRKQVTVFVPPHPYAQFKKQNKENSDAETLQEDKSEKEIEYEKRAEESWIKFQKRNVEKRSKKPTKRNSYKSDDSFGDQGKFKAMD